MSKDTGGFLSDDDRRDFELLIQNYEPSQQTIEVFADSKFAVIAGPAGAGKDTLRGKLVGLQPDKYRAILSTTTRGIRPREKDGIDYHFVDKETMRDGLRERRFLQAALVHKQQVSSLDINDIEGLGDDQTGLSILVVGTEQELRVYKPDIKTIFLVPPSLEAMKDRISRATRNSNGAEIARRLEAAKNEIAFALENEDYYCLTTVDKDRTAGLVDNFITTSARDRSEDQKARKTMKEILEGLL